MIIRTALPADANLIERINETAERARTVRITHTLPIEVTLGTKEKRAS